MTIPLLLLPLAIRMSKTLLDRQNQPRWDAPGMTNRDCFFRSLSSSPNRIWASSSFVASRICLPS
ncbi:hypothetical protein BH11PLA2_BH11PLA2_31600 [soil metagenome]